MSIWIRLHQAELTSLRNNRPEALRLLFERRRQDKSGYVELSSTGPRIPEKPIQLYCSKKEGEQLLTIAQTHCNSAVYSIEEALRLADKAV